MNSKPSTSDKTTSFTLDIHREQILFGIKAVISNINALVKKGLVSRHDARVFISELNNLSQNSRLDPKALETDFNDLIHQFNNLIKAPNGDSLQFLTFHLNSPQEQIDNFKNYVNTMLSTTEHSKEILNQVEQISIDLQKGKLMAKEAMKALSIPISKANDLTEGLGAYPLPNPEDYLG